MDGLFITGIVYPLTASFSETTKSCWLTKNLNPKLIKNLTTEYTFRAAMMFLIELIPKCWVVLVMGYGFVLRNESSRDFHNFLELFHQGRLKRGTRGFLSSCICDYLWLFVIICNFCVSLWLLEIVWDICDCFIVYSHQLKNLL